MFKKLFLFLSLFVLFSFSTKEVLAHATPITYEPANASLLQAVPDQIRIHFSETIEPKASGIMVFAPDGTRVDSGNAFVDSNDAHFYQTAIKGVGQGTYLVSWQVVSADDGHFTKGAFAFSVGKETVSQANTSSQIQIQHVTSLPQAITVWLELLGQAVLFGVLLILLLVWRPLKNQFKEVVSDDSSTSHPQGEHSNILKNVGMFMSRAGVVGVALIVVGAGAFLILKTLDLEQLRVTDFVTTFKVFVGTLDGLHALIRMGLALVFAVVFFVSRRRIFTNERIGVKEIVLFLIAFLMVLSRSRVSHAAATNFFPSFSIFITSVHLLSKELWIGGLVVFTTVLLPVLSRVKTTQLAKFAFVSFSKVLSIVVGLTAVTGAYIVWIDLKSPVFIFSTEWGGKFIILSLLGGTLLLIRLYHQLIVEKPNSRKLVSWVPFTISLEMFVSIALLLVTSVLILTTPPYPPTRFTFDKQATSQGATIDFQVHPTEQDQFLITVTDAKNQAGIELNDIIATLTNGEKGIGPLVVDTEKRFAGGYVFPRSAMSLPGVWKLDISARRPNAFDATASFSVNYPHEVDQTETLPEHRSFGVFELILLVAVVGFTVGAFFLYRFSNRRAIALLSNQKSLSGVESFSFRLIRTYSFGILGVIIIALLLWVINNTLIKTDFENICERDGNFWLQSVPMKDGTALSTDTQTGCTLNLGQYHFIDQREYAYFTRPRQSGIEIKTNPEKPVAWKPTHFTVNVVEIARGQKTGPVQDISIYHDRILHMIIVGEDLKTFAHIHSEDYSPITPEERKAGEFPFHYVFPKAGRYAIVINYVVGGRELSQQSYMDVGGEPVMDKVAVNGVKAVDESRTKDFGGYGVALEVPTKIKAGEVTKFTYNVAKDGKSVTDLQPYLGAAMHLAIVPSDLAGRVIHTHGQVYLPGSAFFQQLFQNYVNYHSHFVPDHFGPKIQARITFPTPGVYVLFGELKHDGQVILTSFTVRVE